MFWEGYKLFKITTIFELNIKHSLDVLYFGYVKFGHLKIGTFMCWFDVDSL